MIEESRETENGCVISHHRRVVGFTLALLAGFSYALSGLFVKYVGDAEADAIIFIRCSVQYIFVLPLLAYKKERPFCEDRKTNLLLLLRGLLGPTANWLFVYALLFMPLGDVLSIAKTDVALIGFFACICLKERCSVPEAVFTLLTFVGLVLVAQPSQIFGQNSSSRTSNTIAGALLAFGSAILGAFTAVIIRNLGAAGVHFSVSMIHYAWVGTAFSAVVLFSKGIPRIPCAYDLGMMFLSGVAGVLGQLFLTISLQHEKASHVAVVLSTQIIFGLLLQLAFLAYVTTVTSLIGSIVIFVCTVALAYIRVRGNRE